MKQSTFEKNGGYFIGGVAYMDCKITGEPVANVSTEATSVIGSKAVMARVDKMFPSETKPQRVKTGRPAGWHWMAEFVDKDGTVYHRGKEQPKLKGKLKPTKVTPPKKKKTKRRSKQEILVAREAEKKAELKKAVQKQKKKDVRNNSFSYIFALHIYAVHITSYLMFPSVICNTQHCAHGQMEQHVLHTEHSVALHNAHSISNTLLSFALQTLLHFIFCRTGPR